MRAIVQAGYGSADVLHLGEIDRPAAGHGDVLLRVHASGLDRGTWHLMAGQPYLIRLVSGLHAPRNPVPGLGPSFVSWFRRRSLPPRAIPGARPKRRHCAT